MNIAEYLVQIDKVIQEGKYKDDWLSLQEYPEASWYADAKFGTFIHWGLYSVPAFDNEWYSRNMYIVGSKAYKHHIEKYGPHSKFGYKDFIPMFKAEKFDAKVWIDAFVDAGMRYVTPVAEHHDGYKLYKSELSKWNSVESGPCRDVLGELCEAGRKAGLKMGASSHRAEHFWFMNGGRDIKDSDVLDENYRDFYGPALKENTPITKEWLEDWLASSCELVDRYHPSTIYFDWWIEQPAFRPYIKKFAAYYYNRSVEWNQEVCLFYKNDSYMLGSAVYDVERGGMNRTFHRVWQTDTAIARNSWGYTENNQFKSASSLARTLVDTVSKNGCLMLDVGPKADGTLCDEELNVLKRLGEFTRTNGEAIYGTRPFIIYGEGKSNEKNGMLSEKEIRYRKSDFRFTFRAGALYVFAMQTNKKNTYLITSAGKRFKILIDSVSILGSNLPVTYAQTKKGLELTVGGDLQSDMPICFKVNIL